MHSELASVFDHVDRERDNSVDRLLDYLRHPSISAHNIGIRDVADRLVGMLTAMGLETTTMPTAGHPMVVAQWSGASGRPTVLLYGHYDVQPPDPVEAWTTPPFEPTIRDGRIFARGVADNKGRGSKTGYSWSRVDVAGSGDGTLTFSGAVRDGSMCWRSGEAAGGRPQGPGHSGVGAISDGQRPGGPARGQSQVRLPAGAQGRRGVG